MIVGCCQGKNSPQNSWKSLIAVCTSCSRIENKHYSSREPQSQPFYFSQTPLDSKLLKPAPPKLAEGN